MNQAQKQEFVASFSARVKEAPFIALADFRGITAEQVNGFRRALDKAGVDYKVVKNKLALRAIEGTEIEGLGEMLSGMTAWVLSGEDGVGAAKALKNAAKELIKEEKLSIKGGFFDGDVIDAKGVGAVAELPSKEELLATLLATIQQAPRQVLGVLQAPGRDLLYLLKNYENKLEGAE